MMKKTTGLLLLPLLLFTRSLFAQPTDNAYKTFYNINTAHWTDQLKWGNVYNVKNAPFNAVGNGVADDSAAVANAVLAAHNAGGGVVYFPAGTYFINGNLLVKENVVLRGVTPSMTNALQAGYAPESKLLFPKFVHDITANGGAGNPKSSAFKEITSDDSKLFSNIGIVNLDVNRAGIAFHPHFDVVGRCDCGSGPNSADDYQPREKNKNILVMGVRSNNVAIPDPGVPRNSQLAWQRFSWRFAGNIDIYAHGNTIIANNRINDAVTDDFFQPGYLTTGGASVPDADSATIFRYTDHLGIVLNRGKIVTNPDGSKAIRCIKWYPYPWEEPATFVPGNEIVGNYIYRTMRTAIQGAGNGLIIKNNIVKDNANKRPVYLRPDGSTQNTNYSATYENRGIDFGGWDVTIENNDVEAFDNGFPGTHYRSICGEGIMNQGNSGGSIINGVKINNNKINSRSGNATNPAIAIYKTRDASNIEIKSNEFPGNNKLIYVVADANGASSPNYLSNVLIADNINPGRIIVNGSLGVNNVVVKNNVRAAVIGGQQTNNGQINATCGVILENNTGDWSVEPCGALSAQADNIPVLVSPDNNVKVAPGSTVPVVVKGKGFTNVAAARVSILVNGVSIADSLTFNVSDTTLTYNYVVPAGYDSTLEGFTVRARSAGKLSEFITVYLDIPSSAAKTLFAAGSDISVYPNPALGVVYIAVPAEANVKAELLTGAGVPVKKFDINGVAELDLAGLPSGMYFVKVALPDSVVVKRLIKE